MDSEKTFKELEQDALSELNKIFNKLIRKCCRNELISDCFCEKYISYLMMANDITNCEEIDFKKVTTKELRNYVLFGIIDTFKSNLNQDHYKDFEVFCNHFNI